MTRSVREISIDICETYADFDFSHPERTSFAFPKLPRPSERYWNSSSTTQPLSLSPRQPGTSEGKNPATARIQDTGSRFPFGFLIWFGAGCMLLRGMWHTGDSWIGNRGAPLRGLARPETNY